MSERGSPTDHAGRDNTNAEGAAPAGAAVEGAVADAGSGDANLSSAAPSSGDGDKGANKDKKPTLAEVMKTAVEATDDGQAKSPPAAKDGNVKPDGEAKPGAEAKAKTPEEIAAEDAKLPFHNHPRWKEVIGQNRELTAKVAALEPDAQQFGKITEFMQSHHLSHDEVGEGFIIMAMLKAGDPRGLVKLDEYRDKLATALGEKIPKDIQDQIDSGAITEAAGKELSVARARGAKSEAELVRTRDAETARQNNDAAVKLTKECQAATDAWAVEAKKTDPDFAKKEPAIARYARALMQERGFPKTRADAVQIIKDAYAEVNKDFASVMPAKKPASHVPSGSSSQGAKQAPKTVADAVRLAL